MAREGQRRRDGLNRPPAMWPMRRHGQAGIGRVEAERVEIEHDGGGERWPVHLGPRHVLCRTSDDVERPNLTG